MSEPHLIKKLSLFALQLWEEGYTTDTVML